MSGVPARAPTVVLVGPPGAGKSAVGAALAGQLGVPLQDPDAMVAERAGQSVGELFVDVGEQDFRAAEADAVADALSADGVAALGSGAVERARERLGAYTADGGTVVFLDVSLGAAVPRVGLNAPRAIGLGSPRSRFAAMAAARRPVYAAVATATVDTSGLTVEEVTEAVVALLVP